MVEPETVFQSCDLKKTIFIFIAAIALSFYAGHLFGAADNPKIVGNNGFLYDVEIFKDGNKICESPYYFKAEKNLKCD